MQMHFNVQGFELFIIITWLKLIALRSALDYGNERFGIDLSRGIFIKDGASFRYISGEIHYFRIHPALWEDRLQRIQYLGLNAIQVYVPWNFHEQVAGVVDFQSESRNLVRFLKLAAQHRLYVLLRIGPYVCAELENGGLPWWLLKTPRIQMRTNDIRYLEAVKSFFELLLPLLEDELYISNKGGTVLMLQIENEYGSLGNCDHIYMGWLRDLVHRQLGNEVILYTTDAPNQQSLECGTVDGVFTTVDFGIESSDAIISHFEIQRLFSQGGPAVNSEFYVTWFSLWGDHSLPESKTNALIHTALKMFQLNASFNFYMIHGGTNFGFWSGAESQGPVLTSYDYVAPISEAGDITPAYETLRAWIEHLPNWSRPSSEIPKNFSNVSIKSIDTVRVADLLTVVKNLIVERECLSTEEPINFEAFQRPYNFVLYSTVVTSSRGVSYSASLLNASQVNNIGYVFVNDQFKGVLSSLCDIKNHTEWCRPTLPLSDSLIGKTLKILVENTGRITYETIPDHKGLGPVHMNQTPLTHWIQCGVDFDSISLQLLDNIYNGENHEHINNQQGPSVYLGRFDGGDSIEWPSLNTYFDSRPFAKGFTLVNNVNIGRYWPVLGPQMTLYAPGPIFKSGNNTIIVIELLGRDGYHRFINKINVNANDNASDETNNALFNKNNIKQWLQKKYREKPLEENSIKNEPIITFVDHPIFHQANQQE